MLGTLAGPLGWGSPTGPVEGGLVHPPFLLSFLLCPSMPVCVTAGQEQGAHPHSLSPLINGCTSVTGWLGMVSRGGCGQHDTPVTALLLPRALCQAGTVSSCVSWPSRTPTGSGRAGLRMPAVGPQDSWRPVEKGRVWAGVGRPRERGTLVLRHPAEQI